MIKGRYKWTCFIWYIFNKCIIAQGDKCAEIKIREEITKNDFLPDFIYKQKDDSYAATLAISEKTACYVRINIYRNLLWTPDYILVCIHLHGNTDHPLN